jgi:DedD protein
MIDVDDAQLQIKKKARRRLVGAIAFFAFAALVLPLVMNQEPAQDTREIEIHIPGQDGHAFQPDVAPAPQESPASPATGAPTGQTTQTTPQAQPASPAQPGPDTGPDTPPVAQVIKVIPSSNPASPADPATPPQTAAPPQNTTPPLASPGKAQSAADAEAIRAAQILAGHFPPDVKTPAPSATPGKASAANTANASTSYVIIIGAFADGANVANLKSKLTRLGIPSYTEPSPEGMKTRVRAGPFPSREAASRALEKMNNSIQVDGVITPLAR